MEPHFFHIKYAVWASSQVIPNINGLVANPMGYTNIDTVL